MIRRIGLPTLLASLAVLAIAAPGAASAATTVGQTGYNAGCFHGTGEDAGGVQLTTSTTHPIYTIPFDGVITSFSTPTDNAGTHTKLLILRRVSTLTYNVVAKSNFESVSVPFVRTFPTQVPVQAGQVIGEYGFVCLIQTGEYGDTLGTFNGPEPASGADQEFQTGFLFSSYFQINLSASLEADEDRDGFGDESQDACPTNATTAGPCPPSATGQRAATQKKCTKKKPKKARKKCQKKAKKLPV